MYSSLYLLRRAKNPQVSFEARLSTRTNEVVLDVPWKSSKAIRSLETVSNSKFPWKGVSSMRLGLTFYDTSRARTLA